jgi:hypothetical protein
METKPGKEAEIQENAERLHKARPMHDLPDCIYASKIMLRTL